METKTLIALIAAIVIVGGGVWYFSSDRSALAPTEEGTPNGETTSGNAVQGSGTLASLLTRGGAYRCTVSVEAGAESSGVVYVGNDRLRGDFVTTASATGGREIESHMISKDGYVYTWSDMMPQGVRMRINTDGTTQGSTGGLDSSAIVDYDCAPWAIDSNRFELPANVTFMDLPQ